MLIFNQITLRRQQKILLNESSFLIKQNQKVGLIGQNGCGKSSLFELILGNIELDAGDISFASTLSLSHLAQAIPNSTISCLDFVIAGDKQYTNFQQQLKQATESQNDTLIAEVHDNMHHSGAYATPAKAGQILSGLGFSTAMMQQTVNEFSGGWRMRISLAQTLMNTADLFLLDEPTNHLDLEAIFWLEKWLKSLNVTILVISHDREFLDAVTSHTLHIENQTASLYAGNYSQFEKLRAEKLALQASQYQKQQKHIAHMMSFVERFRAKASKAKQAQSRLKALDKLEIIANAHIDSPFYFQFYQCPKSADPLIQLEEVTIGYNDKPIATKVNFTIRKQDRIALLGPNGAGKSTLIKTLTGELPPIAGSVTRAPNNLLIAYYAQYQLSQLDSNESAITHIQRLTPSASEQLIRDFLGGFNFRGDMATNPIIPFSGGEKARLVLAMLVWQKPNLLLLDEPTNHLDMDMRAAIELALQSYDGAMVLISHDRHLLKTTVNDYYLVANNKVKQYTGSLEDYHQEIDNLSSTTNQTVETKKIDYKAKKIKQNRIKTLENQINTSQSQIDDLNRQLADSDLYQEQNSEKLGKLQQTLQQLTEQLDSSEHEWLELMSD